MPIEYKTADIPTSFATCSLGLKKEISLPEKLKAIKKARFDAIELSMPDLLAYGKILNGQAPEEKDYDAIVEVAKKTKELTDELGLKVLMLQPFANFEGWTKGLFDKEREDAFARAKGWMRVMEAAGTDMLQVGSSDALGISSSIDDLSNDLAELADLLSHKGFRVCYENWCWATHAPTRKSVWDIVKKANQPNLGLCLDTFQSAGSEFGDPTTQSGLIEGIEQSALEDRWRKSLKELIVTVPVAKIFLLQISDAYRMEPPLENKTVDGARPRARWSHDYRPLPGRGGYLPVQDFLNAVMRTGFRGWLSIEVFDAVREQEDDVSEYTTDAMKSLEEMLAIAQQGGGVSN